MLFELVHPFPRKILYSIYHEVTWSKIPPNFEHYFQLHLWLLAKSPAYLPTYL